MASQKVCRLRLLEVMHSGDSQSCPSQDVDISIESGGLAIVLELAGYGTYEDEDAAPVLLELHEGIPRLIVWADINDSEPTHIINLDRARKDERDKEDTCKTGDAPRGACDSG